MALAHVQANGAQAANASSVTTASFTSTSGNLLVVTASWYANQAGPAATPISDSKGNTWTAAFAETTNGEGDAIRQWYAKNISGGTSHTITFTLTGSGFPTICFSEISGAETEAPLDKTAVGTDTTSPHTSPATATTAQADEILIGSFDSAGSPPLGIGVTNGYTAANIQDNANFEPGAQEYKIVAATGAYTADFTGPNVATVIGIGTYTQSAPGLFPPWPARPNIFAIK